MCPMPDNKKRDVEDLYMNDSDENSPSGLEKDSYTARATGSTKFVNNPRSNRIILVVAICLLALMVTVLFNLGTSPISGAGKKKNNDKNSRELSSALIDSTIHGMERDRNNGTPTENNTPGGELVLGADGKLVSESENALADTTTVVYLKPTEDYARAKEMFVRGLSSNTSVSVASANGATQAGFSSEGNRYQDESSEIDATSAYNAGLQAGMSSQSPTDTDRNNNFIGSQQKSTSVADEYVMNTRRQPLGKFELNAGTIISAVMLTGINSDLPGTILGQVSENIYDTASGAHLLIPQGSRIIGTYNSHVIFGQKRILVVWNRIIYPDGSSLNIGGMAGSDQAGYAGMHQYVNNHYGRLIGAAIFSSVFVALGKLATEDDKNDDGTESAAAEAVMEQMTSFGARLAERNLNISPTLMIKPGRRFTIITTKDVAFQESYKM